jgi:hypothetical protein
LPSKGILNYRIASLLPVSHFYRVILWGVAVRGKIYVCDK